MHAVEPPALNNQRLHLTGLKAYWRAVEGALARETVAIEAGERAALAATKLALADAMAEHDALLARIADVEAAAPGAPVAAKPSAASFAAATATVETGKEGFVVDAADDTMSGGGSATSPMTAVVETAVEGAPTPASTVADSSIKETTLEHAEVHLAPVDPTAATPQAVAQRRRAAIAALDERLAPVRAERTEVEAALNAVVEANAALRARLAALDGAKATVAAPA